MSDSLELHRNPNSEPNSLPENGFIFKSSKEILAMVLASIERNKLEASLPNLLAAIKLGTVADDPYFIPEPWKQDFAGGTEEHLSYSGEYDFKNDLVKQATSILFELHSNAPINPDAFIIASAAQRNRFFDTRYYYSNRINDLVKANLSPELLALLLIEMASFTAVNLSFEDFSSYLNPTVSIKPFPTIETNFATKISAVFRAIGLRAAALEYLQQPIHANTFGIDAAHLLSGWTSILHTTEPAKMIPAQKAFRAAKIKCYQLLANGNYAAFIVAAISLHKVYSKYLSETYIKNALR